MELKDYMMLFESKTQAEEYVKLESKNYSLQKELSKTIKDLIKYKKIIRQCESNLKKITPSYGKQLFWKITKTESEQFLYEKEMLELNIQKYNELEKNFVLIENHIKNNRESLTKLIEFKSRFDFNVFNLYGDCLYRFQTDTAYTNTFSHSILSSEWGRIKSLTNVESEYQDLINASVKCQFCAYQLISQTEDDDNNIKLFFSLLNIDENTLNSDFKKFDNQLLHSTLNELLKYLNIKLEESLPEGSYIIKNLDPCNISKDDYANLKNVFLSISDTIFFLAEKKAKISLNLFSLKSNFIDVWSKTLC